MQTAVRKQPMRRKNEVRVEQMFEKLTVSDSESSSQNEDTVCPRCGAVYGDDDMSVWICCDRCDRWFDLKCTSIQSKYHVPDFYFCESCL